MPLGATLWGALLAIWIKFIGMEETVAESTLVAVLLDYLSVVLVTHEMDIAEQTQRIIRLYDGKIISDEKVA